MFHSVSLLSQEPLACGSCALLSVLLWNVFAVLNFTKKFNAKKSDSEMVIKKNPLRGKEPLLVIRVYELVMFLSRLRNRQVWSPGIPTLPSPTLPKAQVLSLKLHVACER